MTGNALPPQAEGCIIGELGQMEFLGCEYRNVDVNNHINDQI